jgi:hypothetical protein
VSKICVLTADRLTANDRGTYLTIDTIPVLLPPNLARLVDQLLAQLPRGYGLSRPNSGDGPTYLFPGLPPTQPISPGSLSARLRQNGIHASAARNTICSRDAGWPVTLLGRWWG